MTTLRQRMIDDMRARNLSPATQRNYIHYVYLLAKYFMRSPDLLEPADIQKFQIHLLHERKLSAPSVNQSIWAMKFFYNTTLEKNWPDQKFARVKIPQTLPEILSPNEVARFLDNVRGLKHRTALMVCYGAGLRVCDVVKLTAADIDAERMTIRIQQGKGAKIATPCFRRRCWTSFASGNNDCQTTRLAGCLPPAGERANTSASGLCKKRAALRESNLVSPKPSPSTRCAIALPPTCSKTAMTSASFKPFLDTNALTQQRLIRMFRARSCAIPKGLSIGSIWRAKPAAESLL